MSPVHCVIVEVYHMCNVALLELKVHASCVFSVGHLLDIWNTHVWIGPVNIRELLPRLLLIRPYNVGQTLED